MPFPLSSSDYQSFLVDVEPDTLSLPDWGGIAQWHGRYVLMFKMPAGQWALSDITGGIPYGGTTINPATYLATVPTVQANLADVFIYSLPQNFMDVALQEAAAAGALASDALKWTAEQVAQVIPPFSSVLPIGPIAVVTLVLLALIYLPKPRRS